VRNRPSIKRNRSHERGAAYLLAITALMVGSVLALALLEAANGYFLAESSRKGVREARYMAEAGVDYTAWQLGENMVSVPYEANITLSTGSFSVTATDDSARDPGTVLITSIGYANGSTHTAKRVVRGRMPFDYGLYVSTGGGELKITKPIISTLAEPGVYSRYRVVFDHASTYVTTGAYSTETIEARVGATLSPSYPGFRGVAMPPVDLTKYSAIADEVYTVNKTFSSLSYSTPTVILVYGTVAINACTYSGRITIVSDDTIQLKGPVLPASDSDFLALISTKKVETMAAVAQAHAIIYAWNAGNTGEAKIGIGGAFNQVGSISCNRLTVNSGACTLDRDPHWNRTVAIEMRMPGTF